ncbi:prolipoprotein diacylglyceryl transferase [Roseobacter sp. HKCCD9010]|uniref:prolipoprotein diacylglyceryl transferase n=1 Tax=unclassified Roseobacter TaxID=196798 RepID=UPI0014927C77|nr:MULTISPECIES: prolipoprotein diacylglyceryl transferase [unclassified Roseobacter]MBF9051263.1 prolipoprotein diacylglyceryl transferase [Rhodobacterales bacterium HKCCD4356]NNV13310.1 prolipoprotein diacylglyceryl transferase [Roseobacter sp. HKCCD7357]NNV17561.1 prolipoprotein diacylglyceryl transferase [Roseobacter sp. HKCCD8768]NNV27167.1 prolipoprotein diacylglyceryl transferase [Roseobacter sp. HKCCD8192]NNV31287.1 prolipoprotein diacylglyceryl transferase [Roseobacter sp. HKCCD9061]
MQAAIPFPDISPELFSFAIGGFEFALRWYALAYIAALLIGWRMVVMAVKRPALWPADTPPMTPTHVENLLTWVIIGVILGGRLGFVLFYQPGYYLQNPGEILMIWQGGMAFHGGLLGVIVAGILFCRVHKLPMASVGDAMALAAPVGLFLGRIANFINAELWGRPTDLPWGVIFPGDLAQACPGPEGLVERAWETLCARHPSQLYEAALEGLILGAVILWLVYRRGGFKIPGQIMGLFLAGYGLGRFIVEYFRQADPQFITPDNPLGHVLSLTPTLGLSMGQLLSLPMLVIGIAIIVIARRRAA